MGKDPAFLFYPNDYIGGTMGMTFEEKGAYIELLMLQFNRGHMTSHMIGQTLGHMTSHMIGQEGGQTLGQEISLWDKIKGKFKIDEHGLYYNERLELEVNRRKAFIESRFNNISGKNQYSKIEETTKDDIEGHMTPHMEDINKDKKNKDRKGVKGKKTFIPPDIEEVIEYFTNSGYTKQAARKAYDHYELADWHDTNGHQVLNWKQKMHTNWFKDENKIGYVNHKPTNMNGTRSNGSKVDYSNLKINKV
jgi:hypothetical protein